MKKRILQPAALALVSMGLLSLTLASPQAEAKTAPGNAKGKAFISLNMEKTLATVPKTALGINTATWDGNLFTNRVPIDLKKLNVKVLRWPGGSFSDTYNWESAPFAFNQFIRLAGKVGAQPLLTVNYGSGTPEEAAAWVKYANITHHDGVKYWEIGNEIYGDGEYQGVTWENNLRAKKGPTSYGKNALKFITAMRKVDPNIQIGVVATIPTVWPSGIKPYWDRTLLPIVIKNINFIVIHWYPQNPGQENDAKLLSSTGAIPEYMSKLRQYLRVADGKNAKNIKIFVDETNSVSSNPGKQTVSVVNALFLAKDYNSWLMNGAANVSWWALHNNGVTGGNISPNLYGNATFGDYGILSNGDSMEPPVNTPFPPFYSYTLIGDFVRPGDQYVSASSSQSDVSVYAVRRKNHGVALMLVNSSPTKAYSVKIRGLNPFMNHNDVIETYGSQNSSIVVIHARFNGNISIPPYSVDLVMM